VDRLLTLSQACKLPWLPSRRGETSLTVSCLWRWIHKGAKGANGTRIHLASSRVGSTTCITEQALRDFFEALATKPTPAADTRTSPRAPGTRARAAERAGAALEKVGI
jgi:hypothetical protein